MVCLLDANTPITAHNTYYPLESVPEFWSWLQHQAAHGKVKVSFEIFEEIKEGSEKYGKDPLFSWLQTPDVKTALVLDESVDATLVLKVVNQGYAPDLTDTELEQLGRDPFLIAYALVEPGLRTVVTAEVSKPRLTRQNRKVPDVCKSLGLRCCNPFEFNRALGFSTNWQRE